MLINLASKSTWYKTELEGGILKQLMNEKTKLRRTKKSCFFDKNNNTEKWIKID